MAENKNDHLADALSAMSAGEHPDPHEHLPEDESIFFAASTPLAAPEPAAGLRPAGPPSSPVARPSAPVAKPIGKIRPSAPSEPVPQGRPITPARPSVPPISNAPVSRRPFTPSAQPRVDAPSRPPEIEVPQSFTSASEPAEATDEPTHGDDWMGISPEDDDAMMAPAPDASAFAPHASTSRSSALRRPAKSDWKPTVIPILLTTGVLFLVFSSLKFILGSDSPYAALSGWVVGMVAGMGVLLLGLGVFTMMQVKAQVQSSESR